MMLRKAVAANPECDGIVLASHGLFTWGNTQRECYTNSIRTIDQMGEFVEDHARRRRQPLFGGLSSLDAVRDPESTAAQILPQLRGRLSSARRVVAHWDRSPDALTFAGSNWAADLCRMGTSCPDHFLRTRICPLFLPSWPELDARLDQYRREYTDYYRAHAQADSPGLRDANPSVVVIPGLGIFGFGKDKREARITTEFFVNAIHVMAGATALADDGPDNHGNAFHNYTALPRREAFRIEYWALEEAKLRRQPAEKELSRRIALVTGGGSGIGREVALQMASLGAHVVVADQNAAGATDSWAEAQATSSAEMGMATAIDLTSPSSIEAAVRTSVLQFGGIDIVVNTAAIFPEMAGGASEAIWSKTLQINVTANHLLADAVGGVMKQQGIPASIVLTSSANAVVPKQGSEPYDVSKAAVNHLIRELAIGLGPLVRVNGIAPATVVSGSTMFPRDRVMASLRKYSIEFDESATTETLRSQLAEFYARRTITRRPILPSDCAQAIVWLASDKSAKTTGHIIPVDGGLPDAFLR
jgi:rhamnulose-1-phosphate aldolase/alcohol dehydrogenase